MVLPERRTTERCRGLLDRLAAEASGGLGHRLVEFDTDAGAFTICRDCGRYGARRAIKLKEVCDGDLLSDGGARAWRRVFELGRHPKTYAPFGAFRGIRNVNVDAGKVRSKFERSTRAWRLGCKTKPWAAAYLGNVDWWGKPSNDEGSTGQDDLMQEMFGDYQSEDENPFGEDVHTIRQEVMPLGSSSNGASSSGDPMIITVNDEVHQYSHTPEVPAQASSSSTLQPVSNVQRIEILRKREKAVRDKFAKDFKKEAQKEMNKAKRKAALAKKVKKAGIGALSGVQAQILEEGEESFEVKYGMVDEEPKNDGTSEDERLYIRNDERARRRARSARDAASKEAAAVAAEAAAAAASVVEEHLEEGWLEKQLEEVLEAEAEKGKKRAAERNTAIEETMPKRARTMPLWGAAWKR